MTASPQSPAQGPFVVAHRAGNDLRSLRAAERLRTPLIEADLRLYAGRVEVRHLKTMGPVPILWDRWKLAAPWTPRLLLDDLLAAAAPATQLMLDLKGSDVRLAEHVTTALAEHSRRETVCCSQNWALLAPMRDLDSVRVVHSVGSRRQLATLRDRFAAASLAGVSIHKRLLDAATVSDLRHRAAMVLSWPIRTVREARQLATWGVDGLISERFELLTTQLANPATRS